MLAAVHVAREQQHAAGRAEHEHDADDRFLHVGPDALGPREQQRAAERRRQRGDLHRDACGLEAQRSASSTPQPAICAIARSMNTMPRASTCMPSGTCVAVTSRPATNAGSRIESSSASRFTAPP